MNMSDFDADENTLAILPIAVRMDSQLLVGAEGANAL